MYVLHICDRERYGVRELKPAGSEVPSDGWVWFACLRVIARPLLVVAGCAECLLILDAASPERHIAERQSVTTKSAEVTTSTRISSVNGL